MTITYTFQAIPKFVPNPIKGSPTYWKSKPFEAKSVRDAFLNGYSRWNNGYSRWSPGIDISAVELTNELVIDAKGAHIETFSWILVAQSTF